MPIEYLGFGLSAFCFVLAAYNAFRMVYFNQKFVAYLKENHYQKWNDFLGEDITDLFRHLFWTPLGSERSFYYFTFKSSEDFGDKQVKDYKRQVKYGAYGFIINAIACFLSFGITGFILSR